jgi:DNA polymerase-3 subunit beta
MKITIQSETMRALLAVAAKQDIRYYLNGICVDARDNGDVVLVATNGHVLLAVPVAADDVADLAPGQYIIPRDTAEAVKPIKAGRTTLPLQLEITTPAPAPDPDRPDVTVKRAPTFTLAGATTAGAAVMDGQYPDWRRVMPAKASGEPAQFQPDYVAAFGAVAKLLGSGIPVIHHNGNAGALVTGLGAALGVIMPMRTDAADHPGLPAWAKREDAAAGK